MSDHFRESSLWHLPW